MLITPEEVSKILGAPIENVKKGYSALIEYLNLRGENKVAFQVALLATIGVEAGKFLPVRESYWLPEPVVRRLTNKAYSNRKDLGNLGGDDGFRYRGGGIGQLTGRHNYRKYGRKIKELTGLDIDLEKNPELIEDPQISMWALVEYALDHGLSTWAQRAYNTKDEWPEEYCWRQCRLRVNGGLTHYDKFLKLVEKLKVAASKEGTNV